MNERKEKEKEQSGKNKGKLRGCSIISGLASERDGVNLSRQVANKSSRGFGGVVVDRAGGSKYHVSMRK